MSADSADEVLEIILPDKRLAAVHHEDMNEFAHVKYIDVGENLLHLNEMACFTHVRELHLHCNGIRTVVVPAQSFAMLEVCLIRV